MALLVSLSTMSFTIDMHYCGGNLVDSALFTKAKTCGMEMPSDIQDGMEMSCCKNEISVIEGQDELKLNFKNLDLDQELFVATFSYAYVRLFEGSEEDITSFEDYPPPLIVKHIYKLDESYLI